MTSSGTFQQLQIYSTRRVYVIIYNTKLFIFVHHYTTTVVEFLVSSVKSCVQAFFSVVLVFCVREESSFYLLLNIEKIWRQTF